MRFSQRIGKNPSIKKIQLESIDQELMNGLWNVVKMLVLDENKLYHNGNFSKAIWFSFFKLPVDKIPDNSFQVEGQIRNYFFNCKWYEVYDFIEFLIESKFETVDTNEFIGAINSQFQREFAGYRLIDEKIAPISNKIEVTEIKEAINQNNYFTSMNGANIHLANSLEKLSDRTNPDYRNSIKESISAVETTCRVITGENTLGKALNALETKGIIIDIQLKSGFEKIYAFTNNKANGIRHAIIDDHKNPDFEDAKYMLVVCSSFINYLIGKCKSFNISID